MKSPGVHKSFALTATQMPSRASEQCAVAKSVVLLVILFLIGRRTIAQEETSYAVHANIIYHFTKYINWPPEKKTGEFIIGVTGNEVLYKELVKSIGDKSVGGQPITIKSFSAGSASFDCHILFIGDDNSSSIKKIASRTAASPVLLVSESEGLAQKGSCINFLIVSDHLKLEINKQNIEQRKLEIASELLQLGKIVK